MRSSNYDTTWISHSSMSDYLKCPKLYYYRSIYKDPITKRKISITSPALVLGTAVHEVLESLSLLPVATRMDEPLLDVFETVWQGYSGRNGGFTSSDQEKEYKERGRQMIQRVIDNPGPLLKKAVVLSMDDPSFPLPRFILSSENNIMLCGKIDWMEYLEETNSVHIIDFKTGKHLEDSNSLQLAIYCLLVKTLQKRTIEKVSFWYLETDNTPLEMPLPDLGSATQKLIEVGLKIKLAKRERAFDCPRGSCFACSPYASIVSGNAEFIKTKDYQDIYTVN